jgi:hypothetical protein
LRTTIVYGAITLTACTLIVCKDALIHGDCGVEGLLAGVGDTASGTNRAVALSRTFDELGTRSFAGRLGVVTEAAYKGLGAIIVDACLIDAAIIGDAHIILNA